jgi:hypothetical protein
MKLAKYKASKQLTIKKKRKGWRRRQCIFLNYKTKAGGTVPYSQYSISIKIGRIFI